MLINNISQHPLWLGVGEGHVPPQEYQKQELTVPGKNDLHVNSDQKHVCTLKLSSFATNLTLKWAIAKLDLN